MSRRALILLSLWLLLVLLPVIAAAQQQLVLSLPAREALLAEDDAQLASGEPLRFAWPVDLALVPDAHEGWDELPDGRHRWRLQITTTGASSLNLGFSRFDLPWGGSLVLTSEAGPERRFTAADNRDHGELWTPVVLGDAAMLTLELPAGSRDQFALELQRVGLGYRFFGEDAAAKNVPGWCNIDVVCPEGDPWRREIRSVAVYSLGGSRVCSGAMINNTARDGTPYFLTAFHCGIRSHNAASVVVYWNFESPECGMLAGGSLEQFQTGAIWRAQHLPTDMTLVELSTLPDSTWQVTYAGWDRSGGPVSSAVGIHHPRAAVKCISFENDPLQVTSYLDFTVPGDGTHWRVVDWDLGTTEPGSSGSPLLDPAGRIIGQLHGGYAACDNNLSDWYGRLAIAWLGGGTPATQLAAWLDPLQTGVASLGLLDPLQPEPDPDPDPDPEPDPQPPVVLQPVRPNPYLAGTLSFRFELARAGHARLAIFDLRGRLVATVLDEERPQGLNLYQDWAADGLGAGVYVVRLEALGRTVTSRWTLLR
jgi:lysyl endopeptidase